MGQVILQALGNLFTVQNLIFANIGIFIGIIFGAIPGMNGNLAITVLLPFTFQMDTVPDAYSHFLWSKLWRFYQFDSNQYTWYECSSSYADRWLSDVQEWTAEKSIRYGTCGINIWWSGQCILPIIFCTTNQ